MSDGESPSEVKLKEEHCHVGVAQADQRRSWSWQEDSSDQFKHKAANTKTQPTCKQVFESILTGFAPK
jgi:hypothetical protein